MLDPLFLPGRIGRGEVIEGMANIYFDKEIGELAERMRLLPIPRVREILVAACVFAAAYLDGSDPKLNEILGALKADRSPSEAWLSELEALASDADDDYFTLQDAGAPEEEWERAFAKARLLTAVRAIFDDAEADQTADAIYELSHTVDDRSKIIALIEAEMEGR